MTSKKKLKPKARENGKLRRKWLTNNDKKTRQKKKEVFQKTFIENPDSGHKLNVKSKACHPSFVEEQPELLNAIVDIAKNGSSIDERSRIEVMHSIKALDELHRELTYRGYKLLRSALYYHLLAANSKTVNGKRHVQTVSVKLIIAQN